MPTRTKPDLLLYADGAINPTRSGAGAVALDRGGAVVLLTNRTLPIMNNNEAEYAGLLLALELAAHWQAACIEIRLDSEVVVNQMNGRFAVNSPKLKIAHQQACAAARAFRDVLYVHIPRERNAIADALAGEAADGRLWHLRPNPEG